MREGLVPKEVWGSADFLSDFASADEAFGFQQYLGLTTYSFSEDVSVSQLDES
jgi:hypothetical protein